MNKGLVCSILLFIGFSLIYGQGNEYGIHIRNYPPSVTEASQQNWAIVQDNRGIIYVGNDENGVLEYDGNEWRSIPTANNSIVRSLACSEDGTVYVGAVSEFGYLAPDEAGNLRYNSLLPLVDSSIDEFYNFWKTYCADDRVYYYSPEYTFIYFPEENRLQSVENDGSLFAFYEHGNFYTL